MGVHSRQPQEIEPLFVPAPRHLARHIENILDAHGPQPVRVRGVSGAAHVQEGQDGGCRHAGQVRAGRALLFFGGGQGQARVELAAGELLPATWRRKEGDGQLWMRGVYMVHYHMRG